jgi:hypothetical protein
MAVAGIAVENARAWRRESGSAEIPFIGELYFLYAKDIDWFAI